MSGRRVLIVEDNEDSALLLAEFLGEYGYTIEVAYDGASALERAIAFKPEVALLDVGLPDMEGYELATLLRRLGELPSDLKLIALTGYDGDEVKQRARAAGFDLHLIKPILPDAVAQAIERLPA